ncbi:MAG TPA: MBL fold metallo-hydrolase [Clostridiaceae bacterium]|nr:MBL fold metallo-hydrolase [Clostridiaceae bacterium]
MGLNKINGNTYYIDSPTNIGVYAFKDKYCLLVDTGINNTVAGKFDGFLGEAGLKPKYIINTHNHNDHSGANRYFYEHHPGCIFYASLGESLFIENDSLFQTYLYGAKPIKELKKRNGKYRGMNVDVIPEYGTNKINNEKFEILPLPGHSIEQIGVATPDKVCFAGDGLFSESILKKYPFPFLFDIEDQLNTIEYIKTLEYDHYILSHGDKVYDTRQIRALADKNKAMIYKHLDDIKELLSQPLTREELLEQVCILNSISLDFRDYFLCFASMGAFIAYLYNNDLLSYDVEDGKLYYYMK